MSTPKLAYSSGSSVKSKHSVRVAQTTADAKLQAVYEESGDSGDSFDYSKSVHASKSTGENVSAQAVTAYLQRMQRGGLMQTFGCMLCVEESNFRVIAFSENAPEMLDLMPQAVPSVGQQEVLGIGTDARTLFTPSSAAALEKCAGAVDVTMLNPISVHCRSSGKPFYAILHRIDVGLVIDFEPVRSNDAIVSSAGVLQSHKLAAKAISRLQALPGGDIGLLCDIVVQEVRELSGYDRVMAYKFHEDEHGEVLAEIRRSDLEPYLGLHYPATDIPQASRFLFMKNKVRMIGDCFASPVKVIQDKDLRQPISLAGSTLRAPHGCHAQYMGYPGAAQLGDAVCGMAAAKITSKDFLFWFRSHTAKEIKWGGAKHDPDEKDDGRKMHPRSSFKAFLVVVKRRSLPWEDIEMDAIHSLQLILRGSFQDIDDSDTKTMIHARLNDLKLQGMDELSTVANEMVRLIETATAPILAVDSGGFINGWNAKVAELTGLPVEEAMGRSLVKDLILNESIDVVQRLLHLALQGDEEQNIEIQLKTFGPQKEKGAVILIVNACSSRDVQDNVVGVCFVGQDVTGQKQVLDKFTRIQGDYKAIVQNPNPLIPPIFGTDEYGYCSEWNPSMEKLTGWKREEVIGKLLVGEIFGIQLMCCRLKSQDAMTKFMIVLNGAMDGQDTDRFPFSFFDRQGKYVDPLLTVNKRTDAEGSITGVFCFLHTTSVELLQALTVQRSTEKVAFAKLKELAYIRQEIKNPLYGIVFTRNLMEDTDLSVDQRQFVETSAVCERQLRKILDDLDLESIEDGYLELDTTEFEMGTVMDAVVSQGMITSREKGLQLIRETPSEIKNMCLYGDQVRLQQVLADFLLNAVRFTPSSEGWVGIKVVPTKKRLGRGVHVMHLEFRVTHPGLGLPEELVHEMFGRGRGMTQEGLGLSMCRKLVKLMNGTVQYIRETGKSCFLVEVELPLAQRDDAGSVRSTVV
ncbi:phytochrome 1 isoform X2 [Physcomitrium patens]|uniref:Phytochrome n=1 Tax=Physcomitrium patens TaxID=3218 RepID=A0A7I4BBP7_PHYPA|nr:phytochrome 1-like isoform X2 [Physcomitrium patens]|eukprot:XP_024398289.1 phytochrome 1-like isoform X2 [Physcomitrella patens]